MLYIMKLEVGKINKIRVEMFPAKNGDCFLISCLSAINKNILVDLAYPHTYRNHLKPKFLDLNGKGESLDLVVFTHVDQDHIYGGITFFKENGDSNSPNVINVKEVWHNSYRHLNIGKENETLDQTQFEKIREQSAYVEPEEGNGSNKVSGQQGTRLAALLYKNKYNWNTLFGGKAVSFSPITKIVGDKIKITVLSPTSEELDALKRKWFKELKRMFPTIPLTNDTIFDDAIEYLAEYMEPKGIANKSEKTSNSTNLVKLAQSLFEEDPDEINASSITFILEYDSKKLLFLGDAPPTLIEKQLKQIYREEQFPLYFDLIKISHHGSENNTNESLLNIIDSPKYLISTNGSGHGHPDEATIARIVVRESGQFKRELFMSHATNTSDFFNRAQWKEQYNFEMHVPEKNQSTLIEL